jgi:multidrug efflux pump subunit AcrB
MDNFWTFFVRKFRISLLLVLFIFGWGIFSYESLPRENSPDVEIAFAVVTTPWPGAGATDVEASITNKIELAIKELDNVKEYNSSSENGVSIISIEFELNTDLAENFRKLREEIDNIKFKLPASLPDDPQIKEISLTDKPIASLSLSGNFSWTELKHFADLLDDELSSINSIRKVNINDVIEQKFQIFLDPKALDFFNISGDEVINRIKAVNHNIPLGNISVEQQELSIRVDGEIKTINDFNQIVIAKKGQALVKLIDLAEIRRNFAIPRVWTKFSTT